MDSIQEAMEIPAYKIYCLNNHQKKGNDYILPERKKSKVDVLFVRYLFERTIKKMGKIKIIVQQV
jgi:hypothetical protein